MNPNELIQRYLHGEATNAEVAELDRLLASDRELRRRLIVETGIDAGLCEIARERASQPLVESSRRSVGLQWRPLTAAAAGIVLGMLCTSVVFGFVTSRGLAPKVRVALFEPSFEKVEMPWVAGMPRLAGQWGGDLSRVVSSESGVSPKHGRHMLRMEPVPERPFARAFQVLDLQSLPGMHGEGAKELRVSASFHAADAEALNHYVLRVFAYTKTADELGAFSRDLMEEAIASASQSVMAAPGTRDWQSIVARLDVPPWARCLVIMLSARVHGDAAKAAAHYLDDLRASLFVSPSLP